jgi:hypothetical protein
LEMVISRKFILFLNSSSIVKCIVGVKLLNVFIIILYLLHCFGKLRECRQRTENIQVYDISLEYRKSLKFQKRRMMMVRPYLGQLLVYIVNLCIENNCFVKILQNFIISYLNSLFSTFLLHICLLL